MVSVTCGLPSGLAVKNSSAKAGDAGSIPVLGRFPGEGSGYPLQYSCLENPKDRILEGYSPWGRYESDTTEHTSATGRWEQKTELYFCLIQHFLLWIWAGDKVSLGGSAEKLVFYARVLSDFSKQ